MTNKLRKKECEKCGLTFEEKTRESTKQWELRRYCSKICGNTGDDRITSIFERLERYQIKHKGCWEWTGTKDGKGYGVLSNRLGAGNSPEKAHRISYEKEHGQIPEGINICHKCDNPECTNPDHLFAGTQKDNMMDCAKKHRINPKSKANLIAGCKGYRGCKTENNKVKK